jgi:hypothetical protein
MGKKGKDENGKALPNGLLLSVISVCIDYVYISLVSCVTFSCKTCAKRQKYWKINQGRSQKVYRAEAKSPRHELQIY